MLPQDPGVYIFIGKDNEVLYIGKAKNLKKRISSYFLKKLGDKTTLLISQTKKIKTIPVLSEIESLLLEANLIQKYYPKYNVRFADNKAYPFIRITAKDKYPKVLTARRMDDPKSLYFGPYPTPGTMRLVLKLTRRIFPYQSVISHPSKLCFYNHIGLCPCPEVKKDRNYKRNIKHLIDFLRGKTKKAVTDMEKERKTQSNKENFERALEIQKKIEAIKDVTSPFYRPLEYEENPNLKVDVRKEEIEGLVDVLAKNGVFAGSLERIECFDISGISGKHSTGSLVVFTNGERDSKWYRRFKINREGKPNDFAMMEELLQRRLNHKEWPAPNLIIVDGGKGQVSIVKKVLNSRNFKTSLIGLAKREEIIITADFKEISLGKDSKALHLIMRIRDEAHRFAINYHKLIRSKNLFGY